jgi:anti-sigma factor RsiW
MSSQVCNSIDTLSMTYLDEELAPEEKRELELHLLDCSSCRERVSEERQEVELLRQKLAMPAAPELVRVKVMRMLDKEDAQGSRTLLKERVGRWLLPGASIAAAAAALMVFAFAGTTGERSGEVLPFAKVVSQRQTPLMIRGEAPTQTWLQTQIDGTVAPRFEGIDLLGGDVVQIEGRAMAKLVYEVRTTSPQRLQLQGYLFRVRPGELTSGQAAECSGRLLHVTQIGDQPAVTYIDENEVGYIFASRDLSAETMLKLVCSSNLIDEARGRTEMR